MGRKYRIERDAMGSVTVPADALWGASTERARRNFAISGLRFPRTFIRAIGLIKWAAADANRILGLLDAERAAAIRHAANEVVKGLHDDQFVVDVFQTGSGTSTNMNANEVIANRASKLLSGMKGKGLTVHPNDHVNLGQSSNDVIPTASHLAALIALEEELAPALKSLHRSLRVKERTFWSIVKTGRTHLQDAVPIRLGQEFQGYRSQIELASARLRRGKEALSFVALGGTAVGTGINTHRRFADMACALINARLAKEGMSVRIREARRHHFQAQNTIRGLEETSGALKGLALDLYKIANDLAWMNSGPYAGIGEIALPELQPGSSIMPGKVNPVIPEVVKQVAARVIGNDAVVTFAASDGHFELNTMWPIAAFSVLDSISLLARAVRALDEKCVRGIRATNRGPEQVEAGLMLATALVPYVGYKKAVEIVQEALKSARTIREVAREMTDLSDEKLEEILDPLRMT